MRINSTRQDLLLIMVLVVGSFVPAFAGTFAVNPVRVELTAARPTSALQIQNSGDEHLTVQVHVVAWKLQGNEDSYSDTDDVLVNPPIFTIEPGKTQVLRLGLRRPTAGSDEVTYRLILEEVPSAPKPGFMGVRTLLRISIPVFARSQARVQPQLSWHAERISGGVKLTALNQGSAHVQVKRLALAVGEGTSTLATKTVVDYLLPRQAREWVFDDARINAAARISLTATTDTGEIHEVLVPTGQ